MTQFLGSSSGLAVQEAAQDLRAWQRDHEGLGVALVYGPVSAEDRLYHSKCPVDQRSVTALSEALDDIGARWKVLNPCEPDFIMELAGYDVALSNLHGPYGEDGRLQGLLDYLRVPYCGSGVAASAVAADKILCKRVMLSLGVPTPAWWVWSGGPMHWNGRAAMVKPPFGGSSVGMNLVREQADLPRALADAAGEEGDAVLVEDYLPGVPLTVGLLELPGGAVVVLPPLATEATEAEFYDADTKLDVESRGAVAIRAAELSPELLAKVTEYATTLWDGLGLRGSARVDFILTEDDQPFVLEVNSTPGYGRAAPTVTELLKLAVRHEVLTPRGALHAGIASLASDLGVPATAEPVPVEDLLDRLGDAPVIVSVTEQLPDDGLSGGHLVILRGYEDGPDPTVFIRDPSAWGQRHDRVPLSRLSPSYASRAITFAPLNDGES